ncbi:14029_t:CDS:2 [Ambispora leptoticha]|uniref:14029_t:CDS:1 n=1 Tax=Ambispora leptoticha TaxID=144679 RepID=A0A9N8WDW7_9GLOM|nr:14029_t:CDS:2 [Ambispora leptoticha]
MSYAIRRSPDVAELVKRAPEPVAEHEKRAPVYQQPFYYGSYSMSPPP